MERLPTPQNRLCGNVLVNYWLSGKPRSLPKGRWRRGSGRPGSAFLGCSSQISHKFPLRRRMIKEDNQAMSERCTRMDFSRLT